MKDWRRQTSGQKPNQVAGAAGFLVRCSNHCSQLHEIALKTCAPPCTTTFSTCIFAQTCAENVLTTTSYCKQGRKWSPQPSWTNIDRFRREVSLSRTITSRFQIETYTIHNSGAELDSISQQTAWVFSPYEASSVSLNLKSFICHKLGKSPTTRHKAGR